MANDNIAESLENRIWDAAYSIRGAEDAPKYKVFILPLVAARRQRLSQAGVEGDPRVVERHRRPIRYRL